MSNNIKQGRRPAPQSPSHARVNADDVFMNPLDLDPDMLKLLTSKGLVVRFINFKRFADMGGQHEAHWRPISRKQLKEYGYDKIGLHEFQSGADADGFIRRQDLVLAVRSKEINEKHKQYLRQESAQVSDLQSRHAQELRDMTRQSGLNAQVHEGYHDKGESEDEES